MPKIAEEYLAKRPASGMGEYEKKRLVALLAPENAFAQTLQRDLGTFSYVCSVPSISNPDTLDRACMDRNRCGI